MTSTEGTPPGKRPVVTPIVLSAGSGTRFGGPKHLARLAGERLVDRAVRLVTEAVGPAVLVLAEGEAWEGGPVLAVARGGATRTESVRNATAALPSDTEVVIVHDIARPLVRPSQFEALITAIAQGADCAVPAWPLTDTLKFLRPDGSIEHRGREGFVVAQSPMAFHAPMLAKVFATFDEVPIEESIAVEELGGRVVTVTGDPWSHHVVDPRDLAVMEQLLAGDRLAGLRG